MNKKLLSKWINVLRREQYPQGPGYLYTEHNDEVEDEHPRYGQETYCCLGVLCEIAPGFEKDPGGGWFITGKSLIERAILHEVDENATKVADLEPWDQDEYRLRLQYAINAGGIRLEDEEFPSWLQKTLGLDKTVRSRKNGEVRRLPLHDRLVELNDAGTPFPKIADYLESQLVRGAS